MSVSTYALPLAGMMGQTVTIEPYLGMTGNQTRSYGAAKTYQCYVSEDFRLVTNLMGQQVVSSSRTHIYPVASDGTILAGMGVDDRLTLPDGKQPRLISVETQYDQFGKIVMLVAYT